MFITISRQYAAGGSKIASQVAAALDWTVVDNAFVDQIAERSGYDPEDVASLEERVPGFLERLAQSSALSFPEYLVSSPEVLDEPQELKLARITRDLVAELGRRDRMVMVGRAAAAVLARDENALHVRVVAPREQRIETAIRRLGIDRHEAPSVVDDSDDNRARYHQEYYDRDWNDPVNYHLVINTALVGYDGATSLIVAAARNRDW
ncbi:cytidylate kinase-like family protein [Myxococcota bacterium]|nr:cytidylate kinase-like family protein [Myxococcota bacterium]